MGRFWKRLYAVMPALALAASLPVSTAFAQEQDGWVLREGNWYYYDGNGSLAKNQWLKSGGSLFWMNEDGAMATDVWIERERKWFYLGGSGSAVSGWQEIGGKWYYFNKETMAMETDMTIGSWYVGKDGAWDPSR